MLEVIVTNHAIDRYKERFEPILNRNAVMERLQGLMKVSKKLGKGHRGKVCYQPFELGPIMVVEEDLENKVLRVITVLDDVTVEDDREEVLQYFHEQKAREEEFMTSFLALESQVKELKRKLHGARTDKTLEELTRGIQQAALNLTKVV